MSRFTRAGLGGLFGSRESRIALEVIKRRDLLSALVFDRAGGLRVKTSDEIREEVEAEIDAEDAERDRLERIAPAQERGRARARAAAQAAAATAPEPAPVVLEQVAPVPAAAAPVMHKTKRRANPLAAVLTVAEKRAVDATDWTSVWAALVALAQSTQRPAPLLGYVEGEGVKYHADDAVQPDGYLTRDAFRNRFKRKG